MGRAAAATSEGAAAPPRGAVAAAAPAAATTRLPSPSRRRAGSRRSAAWRRHRLGATTLPRAARSPAADGSPRTARACSRCCCNSWAPDQLRSRPTLTRRTRHRCPDRCSSSCSAPWAEAPWAGSSSRLACCRRCAGPAAAVRSALLLGSAHSREGSKLARSSRTALTGATRRA
eukprot:615958-Prymnesium_polylepis.2